MTIQEAARTSLDVQDACNLSGVVASFHDVVMNTLWPEARRLGKGTEWVNRHPIVTLFIDKLASLNRTQCLCSDVMDNYSRASAEVKKLAKGAEAVDPEPAVAWG